MFVLFFISKITFGNSNTAVNPLIGFESPSKEVGKSLILNNSVLEELLAKFKKSFNFNLIADKINPMLSSTRQF